MEIKKLACELESWAQEKGWKTVTQLITPHRPDLYLQKSVVQRQS